MLSKNKKHEPRAIFKGVTQKYLCPVYMLLGFFTFSDNLILQQKNKFSSLILELYTILPNN